MSAIARFGVAAFSSRFAPGLLKPVAQLVRLYLSAMHMDENDPKKYFIKHRQLLKGMDPAPLNMILDLRPAVQKLVDLKLQIRDHEQARYALDVCNEQREKAMVSSVKERQRALLGSVETKIGIGETARFALPLLSHVRCSENGALAMICARFREHCA